MVYLKLACREPLSRYHHPVHRGTALKRQKLTGACHVQAVCHGIMDKVLLALLWPTTKELARSPIFILDFRFSVLSLS